MAVDSYRALTDQELTLARWMLEHGTPEAKAFLPQLDGATATSWRCPCGCASFNFKVRDRAEAPPGVRILGDYFLGGERDLAGAFIFESGGTLSGVEVYGLAVDPPTILPRPEDLRPAEFMQVGARE
jgi:hypothetical protein